MALFSRRRPDGPFEPFEFVVEKVWTIPTRGTVLTGRVLSGRVRRGQPASLLLPGGSRRVSIKRLERSRRSADVAEAGQEVGLTLDGLDSADLPVTLGGGGVYLDADGLAGVRIVAAS